MSTPLASDGGADRGSTSGWGLRDEVRKLLPTPRTSDRNGIGTRGSGGPDLRTTISLLPTPRARDWKGCDPNPRGVDLNEALRLLPTPTVADSRDTRLLPTPTASDGERTSSNYGRGNPTLTGALTEPPSAAGNASSAGQRPGQLTFEDA
jgi:hypothetical protein